MLLALDDATAYKLRMNRITFSKTCMSCILKFDKIKRYDYYISQLLTRNAPKLSRNIHKKSASSGN